MNQIYDLIVIGGGPAGYVGAIKAAQNGMKTLLIEKENLGGTCLNVGCIPTKALFQSAEMAESITHSSDFGIESDLRKINFAVVMDRKQKIVNNLVNGVKYLIKKNQIDFIQDKAVFSGPKRVTVSKTNQTYEGKKILIAAGSENFVPPIPGVDGVNVINSTELLSMNQLPESIAIVGGGVIGCEFANIMSAFGVRISVIEMLPKLLGNMEAECSDFIEKEFQKKGIDLHLGTKVLEVKAGGDNKKELVCNNGAGKTVIQVEYVLIATGRRPVNKELMLDQAGVETEKGWIKVNEHMETSAKDIYAAGDITGKSFLAHAAYEEGSVAVDNMCGVERKMNYKAIPKAVFVDTELCSCGLSEQEATEQNYDVITGMFRLSANGKSMTMNKTEGFVKVISEKKYHEILGMHIAGPDASELVTIASTLLAMEATLEDVEATIYPHPSVSEAIREACLDALGRAIHA